ncbi:hypothetical protein B0H65DRAFT_592682 [Neurospora tetraspora]|uniref:Uncharacterized protein n=1 Tax=Neurospora tetraspora TaxID=94610 RepID=A0AAE0MJM2_9PEZI|nr:hypothetical protein B0H65DRAFT_592682 [Neurospora tetraspora]
MSSRGDVPDSLRENIFMLHMAIHLRFCQLKFIFGDEDDDDVEPNNQYFELVELLKIASAIYQCERFQLELYDTPEYRYPIEDQENKDVDRPVYRMFPPGTIQEIRQEIWNEEHHQPAPFYDEHQQFPHGEGDAYSDNGNVHGNPTGYDGERARLNGLTNGLANGHANGHTDGHANGNANEHTNGHTYGNLIEVNDAVIRNLARHNIGDTNMNGVTNGLTNGYTNGLTNGHMNGNFNGYTNGNINDSTNLGDRVNELPNVSGTSASAVNSQLQPPPFRPQRQHPHQPPPQLPVQFPPEPDHQRQPEVSRAIANNCVATFEIIDGRIAHGNIVESDIVDSDMEI